MARRMLVGSLLFLLGACRSVGSDPWGDSSTVLDEAGVVVKMDARAEASSFRVRWIGARCEAGRAMTGLRVFVFDDANGDGALQDGERLASWRSSSPVPTSSLELAAMLNERALEPGVRERLSVQAEVDLVEGDGISTAVSSRAYPAR